MGFLLKFVTEAFGVSSVYALRIIGIALQVVLGALGLSVLFVATTLAGAYVVYKMHLVRRDKTKWSRECSNPDDPVQLEQYNEGMEWYQINKEYASEEHIVNDGYNLYGEYFDFGYESCVIFIPGRTEGLRYGFYFASPYREAGYNLLTIDQRSHGNSDGKYNSLGALESSDLLCWINFLINEKKVRNIVLHGVCIGSACAMYAATSESCPENVHAIIADGMFASFSDSFRNHMKEMKIPDLLFVPLVNFWVWVFTRSSIFRGPQSVIDKYEKPLLMLHGLADKYSTPEKALELFEKCPSENKKIVWFEGAEHSLLRYTDKEKYDREVSLLLSSVNSEIYQNV